MERYIIMIISYDSLWTKKGYLSETNLKESEILKVERTFIYKEMTQKDGKTKQQKLWQEYGHLIDDMMLLFENLLVPEGGAKLWATHMTLWKFAKKPPSILPVQEHSHIADHINVELAQKPQGLGTCITAMHLWSWVRWWNNSPVDIRCPSWIRTCMMSSFVPHCYL